MNKENELNYTTNIYNDKEEKLSIMQRYCTEIKNINQKNECGWTPLYRSIIIGDLKSTEALIQLGADPNIQCNNGETPLYQCVNMEKKEHVKLFLKYNSNPNICQKDGLSPLHCAVIKKNIQIVELLLSNHADPNIKSHSHLQTPVHYAIKYNTTPSILFLLIQYKGSLILKDKDMKTPIDYVNSDEMKETLKKLKLKNENLFTTSEKEDVNSFWGVKNKILKILNKKSLFKSASDSNMINNDINSNNIFEVSTPQFNFCNLNTGQNSDVNKGDLLLNNTNTNQNDIDINSKNKGNNTIKGDMNNIKQGDCNSKKEENLKERKVIITNYDSINNNNIKRSHSQQFFKSDKKHFKEPSYSPIIEIKEEGIHDNPQLYSVIHRIPSKPPQKENNTNKEQYKNNTNKLLSQNSKSSSDSFQVIPYIDPEENKENVNTQNFNNNNNNNQLYNVNSNKNYTEITQKDSKFPNKNIDNIINLNMKNSNCSSNNKKERISLREKYYNSENSNSCYYQSTNNYLNSEKSISHNNSIIPSNGPYYLGNNFVSFMANSGKKLRQSPTSEKEINFNNSNQKETLSPPETPKTNSNTYNNNNNTISNIEYNKNTQSNRQIESLIYFQTNENKVNKFLLYNQSVMNIQMKDSSKLYEWLKEINLLCYYPTFIEKGIYTLDNLILDMKNEQIKLYYNDIEEIGIKKPGHIYRILIKLEIDAELLNDNIYQMVKKILKAKNNSINSNSIQISNEYSCGCKFTKDNNNNKDYYELTSWLKRMNLPHLKDNFTYNGFELIEFFIMQMFSSVPIDDFILKENLHIYSKRERDIIIMQLNKDAKLMMRQVNIYLNENNTQREIDDMKNKICSIF